MAGLHEAAAAFGLALPAMEGPPDTPVWPENWRAVRLFAELQTQWRMGPGGPVGLDYAALPAWCRPGAPGSRRGRGVAEAIQVMEEAALEHWATKRELNT